MRNESGVFTSPKVRFYFLVQGSLGDLPVPADHYPRLMSGYSRFPIYEPRNPLAFTGLLLVKKVAVTRYIGQNKQAGQGRAGAGRNKQRNNPCVTGYGFYCSRTYSIGVFTPHIGLSIKNNQRRYQRAT
ncbi:hypothetical protein ARMSODRAFT_972321 [Armillaria solidipes]|uniref:Uncharacterized protein n=1 Tax=Armillaria solidipes TaxID=1076256 RepID=A0A2H3BP85_9AGAR|nr:hypothetical protein ARMSODRAFT_972321 [Armillaria solidipes]